MLVLQDDGTYADDGTGPDPSTIIPFGPPESTGAALSTVSPNPSIQTSAHDSTATDISSMANVAGMWGATIAGIVNNTPVQVGPGGTVKTGVRGTAAMPISGNTGMLLLLVGGVIVVFLLLNK